MAGLSMSEALALAAIAAIAIGVMAILARAGPRQSIVDRPDRHDTPNEREAKEATVAPEGDLYRSVFQSLADALVVIDDRGNIQSFSPSAERVFGWSAADAIGQSVSILMPAHERDQHDTYLRHYVESGWSQGRMETLVLTGEAHIIRPERETVAVRKDGTPFPARLIVSEVESGGRRMFVGLISDVSERKRLERELAGEMEAKDAVLQELRRAYALIEMQRERMQQELNVGREIQMSLVPRRFPRIAQGELWGTLLPAREVGGDFYDCFLKPNGQLWLCIGDVAGKGVPSALLMAVTKTLVKSFATLTDSPGEVLTQVNAELANENDNGMFVTALLGCVNPENGVLTYSNAGHNPPLLRRRSSDVERLARRHGPVLGAVEESIYREDTLDLSLGDLLLLFTDGVTEALNRDSQLFTEQRLCDVMRRPGMVAARAALDDIVTEVRQFADGAEQADDITMLAFRYSGSGEAPRFRFLVPNTFEALSRTLPGVLESVARCGGDTALQQRFALAFDELVSNVVKYAYPAGGEHLVECEVAREHDAIVAVVVDDGVPFDPTRHEPPDTAQPMDERPVGGLGVHLVRRMFHEVSYARDGGRNVTTVVHRLA